MVQFRSKPNSRLTRFFPVFIDFLHTFLPTLCVSTTACQRSCTKIANVHSADKYRRSLASSGESHLPDCRLRFAMPPSALCKILNSKPCDGCGPVSNLLSGALYSDDLLASYLLSSGSLKRSTLVRSSSKEFCPISQFYAIPNTSDLFILPV